MARPRKEIGKYRLATVFDDQGYPVLVTSNRQGRKIYEHTLIAEKAMGKALPKEAVVHHHTKTQLVICEDNSYHMLLHARMRAKKACGHADWRRCYMCKNYDPPERLYIKEKGSAVHRECSSKYNADRYQGRK